MTAGPRRYDVVVVGSGFGGSVTALRLTEKGYRVVVLEAGRRFADGELPRTSWDVRRFLWAPRLGCTGIQRIRWLSDVLVLAGAGVGGGSLNYANTLYEPGDAFYDDPQWRDITDWRAELAPYYAQASRMLGVTRNPSLTPSDEQLRAVAEEMGRGHTFALTPVGVFFGSASGATAPDPFFGGAGPDRTGCLECGACMTGCRHGAKNTLPKNYLGLAERAGAVVEPLTTVTAVERARDGRWRVSSERTGPLPGRGRTTWDADHVVLAAGALGTQELLHRMVATGRLRQVSPRLGHLTRTNSEALVGAWGRDASRDFTRGVAITSSFHVDEHTSVEPVRYGRGSNAMALLATLLVPPDPTGRVPRWARWVATAVRHPRRFAGSLSVRRWSERSVVALVMQDVDNSLVVRPKRRLLRLGGWGITTGYGSGDPNPTWIPAAGEVAQRLARRIDGEPGGSVGDVFGAPMTAHFLGGAVIGASARTGVVDPYHRVFGTPGLHVVDGAAVSANLGVNPSLTITAQAERAMALWPNSGDPDPRPPLGAAYRPVDPVAPRAPAVPAHAPGALRLPVRTPR